MLLLFLSFFFPAPAPGSLVPAGVVVVVVPASFWAPLVAGSGAGADVVLQKSDDMYAEASKLSSINS